MIYSSSTSLCDHVSVGLLSGYCHFCFCRAFNNSTIVVRDNSQSSCRGAKLFHPVLYDSLFPDPLFISLLFFFFVAADGDGDVDMGTPSRLNWAPPQIQMLKKRKGKEDISETCLQYLCHRQNCALQWMNVPAGCPSGLILKPCLRKEDVCPEPEVVNKTGSSRCVAKRVQCGRRCYTSSYGCPHSDGGDGTQWIVYRKRIL